MRAEASPGGDPSPSARQAAGGFRRFPRMPTRPAAPVESTRTAFVVVDSASMPRKQGPDTPARSARRTVAREWRPRNAASSPSRNNGLSRSTSGAEVWHRPRVRARSSSGAMDGAAAARAAPIATKSCPCSVPALRPGPGRVCSRTVSASRGGSAGDRRGTQPCPEWVSRRRPGNRLVDDRLEDARRDVLPAGAFVDERLHVGLGGRPRSARRSGRWSCCPRASSFSPAASVDRSTAIWSMKAPVPSRRRCHSSSAPATGEVRDLRILAAQLDGDVRVPEEPLHRGGPASTSWTNGSSSHRDTARPPEPVTVMTRGPSRPRVRSWSQAESITATSMPRMSARCRSYVSKASVSSAPRTASSLSWSPRRCRRGDSGSLRSRCVSARTMLHSSNRLSISSGEET